MTSKEQKKQQVEQLAEGIKESQAVVFADYSGVSVAEMTDLRSKLSKLGARLKVVKNTLIGLAAEKSGLPMEELTGPTAVLLSMGADPIESVKAVVEAFKEKGDLPAGKAGVKFGIIDGDRFDAVGIGQLALIPGRAVLQGKLVWSLISPITRFVYALSGNQQSLVRVLSEVVKAKGGDK